ncbi:MAG TPA: alpha/beta hydrolase [Acidimicrobiales bacterium]|jgi:acetyl esterase|nr:alpha/beta hydrolase [Acidimicrobiales bacterium]
MPVTPEVQNILDVIAAAQPEGVPLTPEDMRAAYAALCATESRPEVHRVTDLSAPGPAGDVPVRVYVPTDEPGPRPALVYFHGGGWVIGSVETHDGTARALALGSGATVVSVDYRLAPEHPFPAAVDDAVAAVRWVVDHADELDVDPGRVAVGGDSAGGNLAAVVCQQLVAAGGPDLRFQLLVYPVTDGSMSHPSIEENAEGYFLTRETMAWFWQQYVGDGDRTDPRCSPLHAPDEVVRAVPPALVVTAEYDPLRDEGEAYGARLEALGVPVTVSRYDGVIHGFFAMRDLVPEGKAATEEAAAALRAALA